MYKDHHHQYTVEESVTGNVSCKRQMFKHQTRFSKYFQ